MAEAPFSIRQIRGDTDKEIARLRKESRKKITKEMRRALVMGSKPSRAAIKKAARENLPKRGGLAAWGAVTPTLKSTFEGERAKVAITMTKRGHDLKALEDGEFRHPVRGNRGVWVKQSIDPGFFSKATDDEAPELRRRIDAVLKKLTDDL